MERKIMEWRMKQRLLELDVDRFFRNLDVWSRRLAWLAIAGAVVIIVKMLMEVSK